MQHTLPHYIPDMMSYTTLYDILPFDFTSDASNNRCSYTHKSCEPRRKAYEYPKRNILTQPSGHILTRDMTHSEPNAMPLP